MFTDILFNRRQYVWRRKGEALKGPSLASTIKHGEGNIQVWGCISIKGGRGYC